MTMLSDPTPPAPRTGPSRGLRRLAAMLRRRIWRDRRGVASLEFVLVLPVLLLIFMSAFEAGLLMTRFIMLERSLDMTMRELRLGQFTNPDADLIKSEVCRGSVILKDCMTNIHVEMQPVSTVTWAFPNTRTGCVNREEEINPPNNFNPGQPHQIMLVRVCVAQDAMFPTTGIGLRLPKDSGGAYGLVASSAFVNEPR
ncbi:TadE/TadG family type IV pilus assembly protein [Szabonella alba]|uniref:TadE/TadG family type IV pilus assembly protein n=1 Tax=Szabonella alba TaxID=2804194 RepID=UPI001F22442A|nr:TadE/TadG family type IV pilus assembly protein [Szabonella alba]